MKLLLRFDGACHANGTVRAHATYGWKVWNADTKQSLASGSGTCTGELHTNNVAEFSGLIDGLLWVSCLDPAPVYLTIQGDSMLVINIIMENWECRKPHLRKLYDQAVGVLHRFKFDWTADWIPRESNGECDSLATGAMPRGMKQDGPRCHV